MLSPMATTAPVIPVLVYADIQAAHDFLVRAFGFTPGGVQRDAEGRAVHGEVSLGGAPIWLHRVTAEHGLAAATEAPDAGGLAIAVADVDATTAARVRPVHRSTLNPSINPMAAASTALATSRVGGGGLAHRCTERLACAPGRPATVQAQRERPTAAPVADRQGHARALKACRQPALRPMWPRA